MTDEDGATEAPDQEETQLALLDAPLPKPKYRVVELDDLPPDEALPGPPLGAAFVRSLEMLGVLEPVILEETSNGLRVEAGRRRIKGARQVGLDKVPALVYPQDSGIVHLAAIAENEHRSPNDLTTFIAIEALMDKHGVKHPEHIGRTLGLDTRHVTKLMGLRYLTPKLLEAFRSGSLSPSAAFRAVKLPRQVQAGLARKMEASDNGTLTVAQVNDARQVHVQKQMAEVPDDAFGTPSAAEAGSAPAWPVEVGSEVWGGPGDVEEAIINLGTGYVGQVFTDKYGATWETVVDVNVTFRRLEDAESGSGEE